MRRLRYYPWRAAECLGASWPLPCQDAGGWGVCWRYEGESRHSGGLRCPSSLCGSWRPAWRFGPTHACQGVGCWYCDVSVPGDGPGSCGRTLRRGIRPALDTLLKRAPRGETSPAPGRRSRPHGRMRTIPGA